MNYYKDIEFKYWHSNNSMLFNKWTLSSTSFTANNIFIYYCQNILCENCKGKRKSEL